VDGLKPDKRGGEKVDRRADLKVGPYVFSLTPTLSQRERVLVLLALRGRS